MSLRRRAGAPRLIEWTGERCVPWAPDVQVIYEHLHRYLWAAQVIAGGRVLDLGSGEGFGASILGDNAREVVGIDIDARTVEHAQLNWSSEKVSFRQGTALDLSAFAEGSFDAVVAFEVIEHLTEQQQMLEEISRVLTADGVLIVSTPDRRIYSEASGQHNPFHQHELTREEFSALLSRSFANVHLWGQRTITGSHLDALDQAPSAEWHDERDFFVERAGEEWRLAAQPAALYLVAVASNGALPSASPASTLGDCDLELVRAAERAGGERANALLAERDEALGERDEALTQQRSAVEDLRALGAELKRRRAELAERDAYVRHRGEEIEAGGVREQAALGTIADLQGQLTEAQRFTRRVESSVTWQAFERLRGSVFGALGESSLLVRSLRLSLRLGGRVLSLKGSGSAQPAVVPEPVARDPGEPIRLPSFDRPTASLIIPVYSGAELTRRCLESIRDNTDQVSYEVIVIDDEADEATKLLLENVEGARIIANEQNLGYLRSMNRGAAAARGEWLVLCNNDIEVTPVWLQSMIVCATLDPKIGVIAPKFVSPDGRVSEAGGILWSDGTGVNYGRGEDPTQFAYEFTREVDYGSAAALMVKDELWRELGGFDERYMPMYYEDADLCMQARASGWRVMYEPSSVVVHLEGGTAGTDPQAGHKRHQEVNRVKFVEKWKAVLEAEHLRPDMRRVRAAADRLRGPRVFVVDFRVPMWDRDAGSLRMFEIVRSLIRLGYSVTFLPDNFTPIQPYARDLQRLGVELIYGSVDMLTELAAIGPALTAAILSRPHSASRWLDTVREFAPSATVIYDTVDLHWVRESRRFALASPARAEGNGTPATHGPKAAALMELELAVVRASDLTVTVTEEERAQILRYVPGAETTVIPTVHANATHVAPAEGRRGVLFVGGFEHPPNVDAVEHLVREVMPPVWARLGNVKVTVVGASTPAAVEALAGPQVEIAGWVSDLEPLLDNARALVVPVRFGAGVKGKITQGLAAGLPVVTTPVGAEGLDGRDGVNMLIGETAEQLAERIVSVIEDDELWRSLSKGGQRLIAGKCSLEVLDERLAQALAKRRVEEGSLLPPLGAR